MSQNDQLEFINWLQKKTNAKSDSELEQIVQEMGEDKINEMYAQFKASKSRSFKVGGVIDYVRCLRKKGGKMTKGCMCGGKMDAKTVMRSIGGKIVDGKDNPKQDIKEGNPLSLVSVFFPFRNSLKSSESILLFLFMSMKKQ